MHSKYENNEQVKIINYQIALKIIIALILEGLKIN